MSNGGKECGKFGAYWGCGVLWGEEEVKRAEIVAFSPHAHSVKWGEAIGSLCLPVYKCQSMIEELNLYNISNTVELEFEHELEHKPAVYQYFFPEFGKLYGISS